MNDQPVLQPITRKELEWQMEAFLQRGGAVKVLKPSKFYPRKLRDRNFNKTFSKHKTFVPKYGEQLSQEINIELRIDAFSREGVTWNF